MTETDEEWIALGPLDDYAEHVPVAIERRGWKLLAFRDGERLYLYENRCTHAATRLDTGRVRGCEVSCPLHGARFDLRGGSVARGPATRDLNAFEVRSVAGSLAARVPEKPVPRPLVPGRWR